jgi:hypothetical protein
MEYIAFDVHKRYTQVSVETVDGERRYEGRIAHARGALQQFLTTCERGSPVAHGTKLITIRPFPTSGLLPRNIFPRLNTCS